MRAIAWTLRIQYCHFFSAMDFLIIVQGVWKAEVMKIVEEVWTSPQVLRSRRQAAKKICSRESICSYFYLKQTKLPVNYTTTQVWWLLNWRVFKYKCVDARLTCVFVGGGGGWLLVEILFFSVLPCSHWQYMWRWPFSDMCKSPDNYKPQFASQQWCRGQFWNLKRNTQHYQYIWMKSNPEIHWWNLTRSEDLRLYKLV